MNLGGSARRRRGGGAFRDAERNFNNGMLNTRITLLQRLSVARLVGRAGDVVRTHLHGAAYPPDRPHPRSCYWLAGAASWRVSSRVRSTARAGMGRRSRGYGAHTIELRRSTDRSQRISRVSYLTHSALLPGVAGSGLRILTRPLNNPCAEYHTRSCRPVSFPHRPPANAHSGRHRAHRHLKQATLQLEVPHEGMSPAVKTAN